VGASVKAHSRNLSICRPTGSASLAAKAEFRLGRAQAQIGFDPSLYQTVLYLEPRPTPPSEARRLLCRTMFMIWALARLSLLTIRPNSTPPMSGTQPAGVQTRTDSSIYFGWWNADILTRKP
jgi:hypothetical protein